MNQFNDPSIEWMLENIFLPEVTHDVTPGDKPVILVTHYPPVQVRKQMTEEMVEIKVFSNEGQVKTFFDIKNSDQQQSIELQRGVHYLKHHMVFDESPHLIYDWFLNNGQRILGTEVIVLSRVDS
jgi:hypothetical protein